MLVPVSIPKGRQKNKKRQRPREESLKERGIQAEERVREKEKEGGVEIGESEDREKENDPCR